MSASLKQIMVIPGHSYLIICLNPWKKLMILDIYFKDWASYTVSYYLNRSLLLRNIYNTVLYLVHSLLD